MRCGVWGLAGLQQQLVVALEVRAILHLHRRSALAVSSHSRTQAWACLPGFHLLAIDHPEDHIPLVRIDQLRTNKQMPWNGLCGAAAVQPHTVHTMDQRSVPTPKSAARACGVVEPNQHALHGLQALRHLRARGVGEEPAELYPIGREHAARVDRDLRRDRRVEKVRQPAPPASPRSGPATSAPGPPSGSGERRVRTRRSGEGGTAVCTGACIGAVRGARGRLVSGP